MFFAAAFLGAVALATEQDCPEKSDADLSLVPWIDVDASGFTDGKFEVVLQVDNLITVDMCWFEDEQERVTVENIEDFKADADEDRAEELANETADDKAYCKIPWRSQPEWSVLRPLLKLKDVSDLGLTTNYRYESSVMCETTESFKVDDKEFTRSLTQEMPFFITIPDEVDVEVDITTRLTQPVEEVEVEATQCTKQFGGLTEAQLGAQADQMVLDILAIVDAESGVTYTITPAGSNFELEVTVVPEVFPQLYTDGRAPGEYFVEEITDAMREEIDALAFLDGATCEEVDVTTTFNYFTPEAIITDVTTVAYRDDVAITIVMQTSIERPWRFNFKADNSNLIDDSFLEDGESAVTLTTDCTEPLDNLCDQVWTIKMDGGSICDGSETVDVEMNFSIDLEPNVHPGYSTFNNEQVAEAYPDGLPVTFAVVKEQFTCEVELAAGEITADATMVTYDCPKQSYADLGNDCDFAEENKKQFLWRTWQTVFFQIEVTTTEYLDIKSTELVTLNLHQSGDNPRTADVVETEVDTLLVENKVGVTDIATPGRQNVADSVYADIQRDHTKFEGMDEDHYERTVEFSILLDLDLFVPFVDLEPVDIRFDANVEIQYKDLATRRRRRLLQLETEPQEGRTIPVSARSRNVLQPSEDDLTIVVIIPHQGPEAPGHPEAHRAEEVSSSSEEEGLNMTIVIVAVAVVLVLLILAFAAVMFCMWTTHSAKMAQINVQLERQVASNNGVTA